MPTFRFIHTADLHLDSPFHGLGQVSEHLQTRIARAPLVALRRIVDACLEHRVHCLIIAGDFFDGGRVSLHTQAYVRSQLERLAKAGIVVAAAAGNHDPLSDGNFQLGWPENVIWFPADRVGKWRFPWKKDKLPWFVVSVTGKGMSLKTYRSYFPGGSRWVAGSGASHQR